MIEANNIEKILERQGFIISTVKGDSMLPMLDENKDAVKIVPAVNVLEKYDLPLYRRPGGQLVLHRIIEVKKKHYIICGDNRKELEKVPHRWVIGVTEGFFKDGEYVSVSNEEYVEYVKKHCENIEDRTIIKTRVVSVRKQPLVKRLFPDYYTMVRMYPSIEKAPILLPGAWMCRLAKKTFKRGKK
jgi:hypothetical protein